MSTRTIIVLLTAILALGVASCGDTDSGPTATPDDRVSDAEPMTSGDPLTLGVDNVAIPFNHRDMEFASTIGPSFDLISAYDRAVVKVQIIDEREALNSPPSSIRANPAPVQAKRRLATLLDEIDDGLATGGGEDWGQYTVIFDLLRLNGSWLVRWDGVGLDSRTDPGNFGLWRDDMRNDEAEIIMDALTEAVGRKPVTHVVIGHEMERLILANPEDFANFLTFFEMMRDQIHAQWPEIKVAPGLGWDRLLAEVVPMFEGAEDGDTDHHFSAMRRMWQYVGQPLYANADFIALTAEPNPELFGGDPDKVPDWQYALLAEVQGDKPIVWTSVNWPVTSGNEKARQRDFLERFLVLNAGNNVEILAWKAMIDLVPNVCDGIVTNLGMERTECYAGMLSSSVAPTKLSDEFLIE